MNSEDIDEQKNNNSQNDPETPGKLSTEHQIPNKSPKKPETVNDTPNIEKDKEIKPDNNNSSDEQTEDNKPDINTKKIKKVILPPERSPSPDENSVISRFRKMKASRKRNRKPEDYLETVITLKERLTAAIKSDRERVMQGKFGGEKLKLMPKLIEKLGNRTLCSQFLDMNGLDLMGQMLYKFPNGEYPSANTRNRVLKIIKKMPVKRNHIMNTKFGGFLTFLQKKKDEILENKKLANEIKLKWTRIVLNEHIDYTILQDEQHDLTQAYLKKRSMTDNLYPNQSKNLKKKFKRNRNGSDGEERDGLQQRKNFRRTSYNFIVMPKSTKLSKDMRRMRERDKMTKGKKRTKKERRQKSIEENTVKQGLDVGEDSS